MPAGPLVPANVPVVTCGMPLRSNTLISLAPCSTTYRKPFCGSNAIPYGFVSPANVPVNVTALPFKSKASTVDPRCTTYARVNAGGGGVGVVEVALLEHAAANNERERMNAKRRMYRPPWFR